jgi:cold shock CspA family protein
MRYQGRITEWKDDRGFGFITSNAGGASLFVHVSAFEPGQPRPTGNELVTYEIATDEKRRPCARNVVYVGARPASVHRERRRGAHPVVAALLLAAIGLFGWQHYGSSRIEPVSAPEPGLTVERGLPEPEHSFERRPAAVFSCQGKQRCTEMTSCDEAIFYLTNCPGVEIDGDGDGIPCERQWCGDF